MQTFGAFLVAALAASGELASALPSRMPTVSPSGGLTVTVKPRSSVSYKHPALAKAKALNKFKGTVPDNLVRIMAAHKGTKRQTSGSATTTPEAEDVAYITTIQIGTPPQNIPMDFDTGSSDLWVFSSETPSSSVNGQTVYDIDSSTSAKKMTGASWEISYGDGSSSQGDVYTDVVTIGNISVTAQAVESATEVSDEFTEDASSSGLVGLGMSSLNTVTPTAQKTWFDNAKSQLSSALFTANLNHDAAGTYTFGALDQSQYTGDIYYANLYNTSASYSGYWTFQATGYAVGDGTATTSSSSSTTSSTSSTSSTTGQQGGDGSSGGFGQGGGYGGGGYGGNDEESTDESSWWSELSDWFGKEKRASFRQHAPVTNTAAIAASSSKRDVTLTDSTILGIADTGTTLLMLPDEVVSAYYSQVDGAEDSEQEGGYVFSCDATLPDFTIGVGEGSITIPGSYINWAALDSTGETCYGGLQSDDSIGFSIFGDIALKAAYVVFDGAQGRVGWAAKTLSS